MPGDNHGIVNSGHIGGNASVVVNRIGDEVRVSGGMQQSTINLKGRLQQVERAVGAANPAAGAEVVRLVEQLRMTLAELHRDRPADATRISTALDATIAKAAAGATEPGAAKSSVERLVKAAESVSDALPIAVRIGKLVALAFGFAL